MQPLKWECPKCRSTNPPLYTIDPPEKLSFPIADKDGRLRVQFTKPLVDNDPQNEYLECPYCRVYVPFASFRLHADGTILEPSTCPECGDLIQIIDDWDFDEGMCISCKGKKGNDN